MSIDNIISIEPYSLEEPGAEIGGEIGALAGPEGAVAGAAIGGAVGAALSGVAVTFRTHGGGGTRTYLYTGAAADEIALGADPANYEGTRIS